MKKTIFFIIGLLLLAVACNTPKEKTLEFSNTLDFERTGELIKFSLEELEGVTGSFPENKLPVFISGNDTLRAQFLYLHNELNPDEILIEASFGPKENKQVAIHWVEKNDYPEFTPSTGLHFGRHDQPGLDQDTATRIQTTKTEVTSNIYQMEGPAWENEYVGFRNYFDLRNGIDIFGKLTNDLVLQYVGMKKPPSDQQNYNFEISYHELSNWGMDILKVGNSLGAGAIALESGDSLYRIGDNGYGVYEKLYEGPLKSEFRLRYPEWKAGSLKPEITQYISISSGNYFYKSSLFIEKSENNPSFITGIVNMHSDRMEEFSAGEAHHVILTHAPQAEDGRFLAMAVMIADSLFVDSGETAESGSGITQTYFSRFKASPGSLAEYRFYAMWETTDNNFSDINYVHDLLEKDALRFENPIKIIK